MARIFGMLTSSQKRYGVSISGSSTQIWCFWIHCHSSPDLERIVVCPRTSGDTLRSGRNLKFVHARYVFLLAGERPPFVRISPCPT